MRHYINLFPFFKEYKEEKLFLNEKFKLLNIYNKIKHFETFRIALAILIVVTKMVVFYFLSNQILSDTTGSCGEIELFGRIENIFIKSALLIVLPIVSDNLWCNSETFYWFQVAHFIVALILLTIHAIQISFLLNCLGIVKNISDDKEFINRYAMKTKLLIFLPFLIFNLYKKCENELSVFIKIKPSKIKNINFSNKPLKIK